MLSPPSGLFVQSAAHVLTLLDVFWKMAFASSSATYLPPLTTLNALPAADQTPDKVLPTRAPAPYVSRVRYLTPPSAQSALRAPYNDVYCARPSPLTL